MCQVEYFKAFSVPTRQRNIPIGITSSARNSALVST
jgi:hypothetical protein